MYKLIDSAEPLLEETKPVPSLSKAKQPHYNFSTTSHFFLWSMSDTRQDESDTRDKMRPAATCGESTLYSAHTRKSLLEVKQKKVDMWFSFALTGWTIDCRWKPRGESCHMTQDVAESQQNRGVLIGTI